MTLNEEFQRVAQEIEQTLNLLSSAHNDLERLALMTILQDLQTRREDLEVLRSYFDP